jgi:hypothetical protein
VQEGVAGAVAHLEPLSEFRFDTHIRIRAAQREPTVEPVALVDLGALELTAARWDFAFVVTAADLHAYHKPFALGTPVSSLNLACLSLARLDPGEIAGQSRTKILAQRFSALLLHLFGHLNDLGHSDEPTCFMYDLESELDLDAMQRYSKSGLDRLRSELGREADERLEERRTPTSTLRFYVEAVWDNRSDVYHAVVKIQPWMFFARFSRLTTTAVSAIVVLLITAEAWDMGVRLSAARLAALSAGAIVVTSVYVLRRQRLTPRVRNARLTEQRVLASFAVATGVVLGMVTTYGLLFAGALAFTEIFYPVRLIEGWVAMPGSHVGTSHYLAMCGFVATLGVVLGALGASFESENYFRHVVLVDEET